MDTKILKYIAFLLILAGALSSCETMNTSEELIKPVIPDNEVITFFQEQLPVSSGIWSECFFVGEADKPWSKDMWTECVLINSMDEFKKIFSCSSDLLPAIDFKSYTLIIGMQQMRSSGHIMVEQSIIVRFKVELNIKVKRPDYGLGEICPLYYWGIYPKIKRKSISVNIKYE